MPRSFLMSLFTLLPSWGILGSLPTNNTLATSKQH
jgi:hypothetical protein